MRRYGKAMPSYTRELGDVPCSSFQFSWSNSVFQFAFATLLIVLTFNALPVNAQFPDSVELKNENATVTLSNFRWMTAQKSKPRSNSSFEEPVDPRPLDSTKLYPPGTAVYLYFDYKSMVTPNDAPESVSDIYLTLHLENGWIGNRPTTIQASEGTEFIRLIFVVGGLGGPAPPVDANLELNLSIYGKRKNGQELPSQKSAEKLKLRIMIDGAAVILDSQFEELKAMYRRMDLLEKRVKELESRK